ncbi:DDE superfamily endonuclease [Breznakibacter xylanolyticus]|uniref:DDE superfamily endonuclease n=1 Tax=Breznakibacter xylanolyticus TaxID=990 RepID=A0A2W7NGL2_9BACT|nr:transposase [Breznakibacter xylanolyticus]PZX11859.1 DDE superfamily endonuclease [Breznakibacter xylanolyticus]PZX16914.1 DDE superfamily endonuclease [Breznakibacter xylanolyticus]PZX17337.1 DDE superfamily endonuclease [Breznakibacter xylanolyticus]
MLRFKDTVILSEINGFFTSSEKAMDTIFTTIRSLTFSDTKFGFSQACNHKYTNHGKLALLLLFPFFEVKTSWHYSNSGLSRILYCGKDVFYRLLNDSSINWRNLAYSLNMQLIRKVQKSTDSTNLNPTCLIFDDTDLPKTGRKIELISRIYSHVSHTFNIGFKGLFMGYHDGKSFFSLDFSLHGEKGKNQSKPYGFTPIQIKKQYAKKRHKTSMGSERVNDYHLSKIESMIKMIRLAITKGIRFDYVLTDSWFTCFELIKFIVTRRIGCHFIGMIKMGKTRYEAFGKSLTSKEIIDLLRRKKKTKRSKLIGYYYAETIVDFKGVRVKLFFCKASHKGNWNGMMTTNTELTFEQAYKIYSTRWSVEVFFKESKQHLGLGKCQSQDFDAQIASTTLCMVQYNILSVIKRVNDYETLGELFRASQKDALKLTIAEQVWLIITEILSELSEMFNVEIELLMEKLFAENDKLTRYLNLNSLLQAG